MPEGPEISYMTYYFNKKFNNSILDTINVLSGRYTRHPLPDNFDKLLKKMPSKIIALKNKGKFMYMELEDNYILGIKLNYGHLVEEFGKQCHIEFKTSKGIFYMDDLRNFGTLTVLTETTLEKQLKSIGPDLLNEEVNYEDFYEKVKKHPKNKIGEFLINQKYFSGVGNYVRCEALYDAKISPFRLNKDLKDEEIKDIFKCTKNVLQKAFKSLKDDGKKFVKKVYKQSFTPKKEEIVRDKLEKTRNIYWVPSVQT